MCNELCTKQDVLFPLFIKVVVNKGKARVFFSDNWFDVFTKKYLQLECCDFIFFTAKQCTSEQNRGALGYSNQYVRRSVLPMLKVRPVLGVVATLNVKMFKLRVDF